MNSRDCHHIDATAAVPPAAAPLRSSLMRCARAAAAAILLVAVAACSSISQLTEVPESAATQEAFQNNLSVASAALSAGQPAIAFKLYNVLAERYSNAPEPVLGLGYIAQQSGDLDIAEGHFLRAAGLASGTPALRAEALLGAGRSALARRDTHAARNHLQEARALAQDTSSSMWIENGLAVAAALEGDYETAEAYFAEAMQPSSGHPRITANLVRMMIASGRIDQAAQIYGDHVPSYWEEGDQSTLLRLIDEAHRQPSRPNHFESRLLLPWSESDGWPLRSDDGGRPAGRIDLAASLGVALRLADESDWLASPTAHAALAALPPVRGMSGEALFGQPSLASAPSVHPRQTLGTDAGDAAAADAAAGDALLPPEFAVVLGQSRQWQLGTDAQAVATADPAIADVQLLAPNVLYVIGNRVGRTSVAVLGGDGRVWKQDVSVVLDLDPLRALLAQESDLSDVRVQRVARGAALTGNVGMAAADRAFRLAAASLPEGALVENNLRVVVDSEAFREILAGEPASRNVRVQALARGIVLTGDVDSASIADRVFRLAVASFPEDTLIENNLSISGPQQVNLEVLIAEVERSIAEDLGINWEVFGRSSDGSAVSGFRVGRALSSQGGPSLLGVPLTILNGATSPMFVAGKAWENIGMTGVVDALARAGLANVLARPNITAISGETASFFSGGEYPMPSGYDDGTIIFEYKKFGVLLDFVPTILDDGRIELTVRPEVSEPSDDQSVQIIQGISIPVFNVRRAETTVEVGDGESIVIAGLFRSASDETESGIPLLKDLPVFGTAFGFTSTRSSELELIVTVTARLVHSGPAPGETSMAAAPGLADNYYF